MENANGHDNESLSIPIACTYNESVTRTPISLLGKGRREGKGGREKREKEKEWNRHKLLSHLQLRDLSSHPCRPMAEHLRLRRASFSPTIPRFHGSPGFTARAVSFPWNMSEYVLFIFFFFPRGLSIARFHFAHESLLEHGGEVAIGIN